MFELSPKVSTLLIAAASAAALLSPAQAAACGGTFCDAGPTIMPVDQTGESIVFWLDESGDEPFTEAHIQIEYEGDAERFAWIVPVTAVPEVLVGSQALFDNLLAATVPTFTTNTRTIGDCSGGSVGFCFAASDAGAFNEGAFTSGGFGDTGGAESDGQGGPEILDRGLAGAFEYVTLTGDSIEEITDWLDLAGYAQDEDAPPILDEYLQEGFVFVAIKLQSGADVDEIHPLAIRYPGTEPCIPIRLTRIAAVDDMAIRAFFLGDERVAPSNWPHVELNHSRFDWVNGPSVNYNEVVSLAIDEAGGRAFVSEYAGTSAIVSSSGISNSSWDAAAFEGIEPSAVVERLTSQGLVFCESGQCGFVHPQVEALLQIYLPPPEGVSAHTYWECVDCYLQEIDQEAWSAAPGFAADFAARVTVPAQHALDLLGGSSQLTRLFTLISPHEMIEDPIFHPASGLPSVDNNITGTRVNDCGDGPTYFEFADGRQLALTDDGVLPDLPDNPAAARIERVPMSGPPQVEVDNSEAIDAALDAFNDTRLTGPSGDCSIGRTGLEGLLAMFSMFGIAWFSRRPRKTRA